MLIKTVTLLAIWALVDVQGDTELIHFWDLAATKVWNSSILPKEMNAEWNLGLASFSCAIQKKKGAKLVIEPAGTISLNFFSVVLLDGQSSLTISAGSTLDLKDQSEYAGRSSSATVMESGSSMHLVDSQLTPGSLTMNTNSKIQLVEAKLSGLLSTVTMQKESFLSAQMRTQITFLGTSKANFGEYTNISMAKSFLDVAGQLMVGDRSIIQLTGAHVTIVNGNVNMKNKVEFKADPHSEITFQGANVNLTEGAKVTVEKQAEFTIEQGSSLIMARRDLRLKVSEKALLKIAASTHCLMTDDLTVAKQASMVFSSTPQHDSFRCFSNLQQLIDEKNRNFPEN